MEEPFWGAIDIVAVCRQSETRMLVGIIPGCRSWVPCGVYCQSRGVKWSHIQSPGDCAGDEDGFWSPQRLDDNLNMPSDGPFKIPLVYARNCPPKVDQFHT